MTERKAIVIRKYIYFVSCVIIIGSYAEKDILSTKNSS